MIPRLCLRAIRPLRRDAFKIAMARSSRAGYQGLVRNRRLESGCGVSREDIMRRLELLRIEHRDLDSAIAALVESASGDQMQVARLKKRKLRLRDEIALLEDQLVPDIIA